MKSLESAKQLQASAEIRADALTRFARQIKLWSIPTPPAEPLVLDFGLNDFARVGLVESWICNEESSGYCGKYLFCFAGQSCPMHSHRIKHETFFILQGDARLTMGGKDRTVSAGDVIAIPPAIAHGFTASQAVLVLELSTPCDPADNIFLDPAIARWHKALLG